MMRHGEVSEWFMVLVLKTSEGQTSVGSNPTFSANNIIKVDAWRSTQVAEGAPLERE